MLRKEITYTNFNGDQVTRAFYFNLSKAEIAAREISSDGSFSKSMEAIAASNKGSVVYPEIEKILKWAYGIKSDDGESFIKSDAAWEAFQASNAYSELIMELLMVDGASANFMNSILPSDLAAKAEEARAQAGFRPGAQTLPQSRIDQLQAEKEAAAAEVVQAPPVQIQMPPAVQDFGAVTAPEEHVARHSEPREPFQQ